MLHTLKRKLKNYFTKPEEVKNFYEIIKSNSTIAFLSANGDKLTDTLKVKSLGEKLADKKLLIYPLHKYKYTFEHEIGETKAEEFFIIKITDKEQLLKLMQENGIKFAIYKDIDGFVIVDDFYVLIKDLAIKDLKLLFTWFINKKYKDKLYTFKNLYVREQFNGFKRYLLQSEKYKIKWYKLI